MCVRLVFKVSASLFIGCVFDEGRQGKDIWNQWGKSIMKNGGVRVDDEVSCSVIILRVAFFVFFAFPGESQRADLVHSPRGKAITRMHFDCSHTLGIRGLWSGHEVSCERWNVSSEPATIVEMLGVTAGL